MSRWGKNIVVPLDSLCKEKENTNRPTVARSVGTVGKWGKMGFTSTRTYALSALPAAVAAAAAAASPVQSPASALDDDMSPSVPEPPKPKKFFKSRNAAPPEVIAQIIQHLPRVATSPIRETSSMATPNYLSTPVHGREPIKLKIPKSNSAERKKKTPKKSATKPVHKAEEEDDGIAPKVVTEPKVKKKKEEKKLKPEAPPSRVISRARKVVNYCEDDEDDRVATPMRDFIVKSKEPGPGPEPEPTADGPLKMESPQTSLLPSMVIPVSASTVVPTAPVVSTTPKTPEHPPIVLRISKGTSRLVSTDSEEQPNNAIPSPQDQDSESGTVKSRHASTEEIPLHSNSTCAIPTTPKIIVKPPKPPSPELAVLPPPPPSTAATATSATSLLVENNEEFNYESVKISPDKPPKERLKLIIKTDVIRNAMAAAAAKAAAAAQKAASAEAAGLTGADGDRPEKEKKQKSKKHKHPKHSIIEQLTPGQLSTTATGGGNGSEFKTPSPHLGFGANVDIQQPQQGTVRTIISPPALSERDFDSQSSVLGSISSKGNSTPQPLAQTVHEESCVIHSRGSSVITSDLETSQHSSLVAPPSDIELRLESMMMDGEGSQQQRPINSIEEEPLQEDILAVLRGDESQLEPAPVLDVKINGRSEKENVSNEENQLESSSRRVTRGRGRGHMTKAITSEHSVDSKPQTVATTTRTRTRGRNPASTTTTEAVTTSTVSMSPVRPAVEDISPTKRATRRGGKKSEESVSNSAAVARDGEVGESPTKSAESLGEKEAMAMDSQQAAQLPATSVTTRRGRPQRNITNNNNNLNNNNNNNINKIAANLSAKAGAAEEAKNASSATAQIVANNVQASQMPTRSYGRKRKNQQVTQVLQPSPEELEEQQHPTPAKVANVGATANSLSLEEFATTTTTAATARHSTSPLTSSQLSVSPTMDFHDDGNSNSNSITRPASTTPSSPPRRDYKVKDKFKRTLMLDNQVNCNAVVASPTNSISAEHSTAAEGSASGEEHQQRGSVKLVISKKKGSIFKSRALVPSDQSEQSAVTKRHLYKHRWDAEANGGIANDGNSPPLTKANDVQAAPPSRTAADAIFEDFSEDLSPGGVPTRDSSPAVGKLTRVVKNNPQNSSSNPFDMDIEAPSETTASVKVDRKAKEYYTVVRNVKTAHQIQEIGEYQEMDDDVEYFLDALQPHNPTATRCLSALQLATKCMTPAFRMHVRAHGVVTKFFKALSDANSDLSLGLCTSAIMYILSQEGLNMDLDRDSLELMMNLLESETVAAPSDRASYDRNRQKVRELCEEIKAQGKGTHLNVDLITVGTLAMETLLSLTSKRAGEWFKEELRQLGGLEHIIKTISESCRPVFECSSLSSSGSTPIEWTDSLLDNMQTVERCMRVLENVTQMNEENQKYMLTYGKGAAVNTVCTLYSLCDSELMRHPTTQSTSKERNPGIVMRELLIPVMKVLINLTHTFNPASALGAEMLGKRDDIVATSFHLLLQAPNYIPERCVFELSILVLLLLINLTMHVIPNRDNIMKSYAPSEYISHQQKNKVTAVQAVMEYFYKCEELARLVEKNTDAILDNTDKNKKKQEEVDETVNNLLQKAGHHMEHTLKGSYAGILIGHLISDSEEYEAIVRSYTRDNRFKDIINVLEKYYTFMNLTASSEASIVAHIKSTKKLIDCFKKRDLLYEMNESDECALPLNLEKHSTSTNPHHGDTATGTVATTTGAMSLMTTAATMATTTTVTTTRSGAQRVYKTYSQR